MIESKVRELIENPINDMGILIDSIEYVKEGNNNFLRIVIDRNKIIDIDTVVDVTRVVNDILDKNDIIPDSYILDISSKEKGDSNE
jgi:ribosome maturation factor RimP